MTRSPFSLSALLLCAVGASCSSLGKQDDGGVGAGGAHSAEESVGATNLAPHCQGSKFSTAQDDPLNVHLQAVDLEGDSLTIEVVESPAHGELSGTAPQLTYTPDAGFVGADTLKFIAEDDKGARCREATVTLVVEPLPGTNLQLPSSLQTTVTVKVEETRYRSTGRWIRPQSEVEFELDLQRHSMRSPQFQLWTYDESRDPGQQEETDLPEPRTYRGAVVGHPELVASGVVDEAGMLYASIWNGRRRLGVGQVSVSDVLQASEPGTATVMPSEIRIDRTVPDVTKNKFYVPEIGPDFHGFLARTRARYDHSEFVEHAGGSLVNAVAQIESMLNEADYSFGQKLGIRYDLAFSLVEVNGTEAPLINSVIKTDHFKNWPETKDAVSFQITLADSSVGASTCVASSSRANPMSLRCTAGYSFTYGWTHELGHVFATDHAEGMVDSMYQVMDGRLRGTELTMMQSRQALEKLQNDTIYFTAAALTTPMLPAAYFDYVTVRQNDSVLFNPLDNDYDANGDVLAIARFSEPEHGKVERVGAELKYTPNEGFFGADMFTYTATDGALETTQTIHVMVVTDDLGGHWPIKSDAGGLVDVSGLDANTSQSLDLVVDGDAAFSEGLTTGPSGEMDAFSLPARATDEFDYVAVETVDDMEVLTPLSVKMKKDPVGNWILPHVYDPGSSSFTASLWFKYSNIEGDVLGTGGEQASRVLFGKATIGRTGHPTKPDKVVGAHQILQGGWEIRALGEDLIFEVGFRDRTMAEHVHRVTHAGAIQDGEWHHAVLVIDRENNELRGYLDGVAETAALPEGTSPIVGSMTASFGALYSVWASPLLLGSHTLEPSKSSAFSDPRLYYRALSAAEIEELAPAP